MARLACGHTHNIPIFVLPRTGKYGLTERAD
jgi:hypothetical protein